MEWHHSFKPPNGACNNSPHRHFQPFTLRAACSNVQYRSIDWFNVHCLLTCICIYSNVHLIFKKDLYVSAPLPLFALWCNSCALLMSDNNITMITASPSLPSLLCGALIWLLSITITHPLYLPLLCFGPPRAVSPVSITNASSCICRPSVSLLLSSAPIASLPLPDSWLVWGDTRLHVFLALAQMGPWEHVRDQNVLYLSCQAVPQHKNGIPLRSVRWGIYREAFSPALQIKVLNCVFCNFCY